MKKLLATFSLLIGTSSVLLLAAPNASAATFKCDSTEVQTSIDFGDYTKRYCGKDSNAVTVLLLMVIDFLAIGVGIAVVAGIAWGGLIYAQAGGDSGKTKEAINIITNAVIGLVLFIVMWALANFFVPGGVFN